LEVAVKEYHDTELVCLGDFWHVRYRIPVALQNRVHDWLWRLGALGITFRLLPGNHDQIDTQGENALQVFDGLRGVTVYTNPSWDKDGFWIPYRQDPQAIEAALDGKRVPEYPKVLFMHHGVRGALMNNGKQDTEGLPIGLFSEFERIFCGHYHKRQYYGKSLCYVGSPYQTKADETGQDKGFTVWKRENNVLEHVTKRWGKRYHNLMVSEYQKGSIALPDGVDLSRDEVRVVTKVGVDAEKVGKALAKMGLASHVVTPEAEPMDTRLDVGVNATLLQFAKAYVVQKAEEGESDKLWRVFQEITGAS
jgi:DNA repair exonuclease SbcCD nuclease subunit